jgi:tetratricopeptide (TPR) repeat protein
MTGGIVSDLYPTIRHLAFFEALGTLEEGTTEWHATTAGFVVLRLVDAWFDEGAHIAAADAWGLNAVRDAVGAMPAGDPARTILGGVVDAVATAGRTDFSVVATRLSAYGRALHFDAKWRLAADVYETLLTHAHPIDESDVYINASMQLGYCLRMLGEFDQAEVAYADAGRVATSMGDVVGILRARIADARLSMLRGNLPRAEEILDDTITRANSESLNDVAGLAMHERSIVAYQRHEYPRAIRFAYDALAKLSGQSARDRVLADIAASFLDLGVITAARDAFLVLAATAQEQYVRWSAALNLLEMSVVESSEPRFEMYRRELAGIQLPSDLQVHFHLHVGKGYAAFGRPDRARVAFTTAADLAAAYRLNQLLFSAEDSLRRLEAGERLLNERAAAVEYESVADVADAIHEMRNLAGVTA